MSSTITSSVTDQAQRDAALDPTRSFIVQAPAGSGKTGLITQRFLVLLALVEQPEEIVAITFTRKAAAEMRSRILDALRRAQQSEPENGHEKKTWLLASKAMARNIEQGWDLLDHPARLNIQTIDSLCASLTRQMPLLSRFGAQPGIAEDADELYRQAARQSLADLEKGERWSPAIDALLRHLDNNLAVAEAMLVSMLQRRDQWLRHLVTIRNEPERRNLLEQALANVIEDALLKVAAFFPESAKSEIVSLVSFAADNVADDHALAACRSLKTFPTGDVENLSVWHGLVLFLLTEKGLWRKSFDKKVGIPAPSSTKDKNQAEHFKAIKQRCIELVATLSENEELLEQLEELRYLPLPTYSDDQWQVVEALCELLVVAVAHLRVVFVNHAQVDFSEIAQSAVTALGHEDRPSDLALALNYRIQHLLVDEFQDTAFGQYVLLERLTAGWQMGDGHTLFVVGDPMQSIYRFREADVGLYLRAQQSGIGQILLEPLALSVNFRSQANVVNWVNETFNKVLPLQSDVATGAVSYTPSDAFHQADVASEVIMHPFLSNDPIGEAAQVVELIKRAYQKNPSGSVAILVRARSHLAAIIPALKNAQLSYRAIEIEQLTHRPVVQDLYALTRALLHPADKVAWLALLRAPWCGLSLVDLEELSDKESDLLMAAIFDEKRLAHLSVDGRVRLENVRTILEAALANRRKTSLRRWIEGVWLALGGPATVSCRTDLEDAEVFLQLLEGLESGGDLASLKSLNESLERLFALPDIEADERLQLMTIHKSKGLEFDTVILPGLGRKSPPDENRLLMWAEQASREEEGELILAPIRPSGEKHDSIYTYLKRIERHKAGYEFGRLFYVAATRARNNLHLLGHVTIDAENRLIKPPQASSLLRLLWSSVSQFFSTAYECGVAEPAEKVIKTTQDKAKLQRLVAGWQLPETPQAVVVTQSQVPIQKQESIEFIWASDIARNVGIVVHALLHKITTEGVAVWNESRIQMLRPFVESQLQEMGVNGNDLGEAAQRVEKAIAMALADKRGRWLLDASHQDSRSEYAVTGVIEGKVYRVVMDRTFIDETGRRWIVDYKTGVHEGGDLEFFLINEQQRYLDQLERYATLMGKMEQRPIQLGLYFPLMGAWREWAFHA